MFRLYYDELSSVAERCHILVQGKYLVMSKKENCVLNQQINLLLIVKTMKAYKQNNEYDMFGSVAYNNF